MATISSLLDIPQEATQYKFLVEKLLTPAYANDDSNHVCILVGPQSPLYHEIYTYLKDGITSPHLTCTQCQSLIQKSSHYAIISNTLYRQGYHNTLSRCLDENKVAMALKEVHSRLCGAHTSGIILAHQILRAGYYWPTIKEDSYDFFRKCLPCQQHANLVHAPAQDLQPIAPPWPFSCWGLDLVGIITPLSSDGHKWIIIATEYFTKWVEEISLVSATGV